MNSLSQILLPVDYSERCLAVAHHAISLAERFGAEITILRVLAPVAGGPPDSCATTEEFRAARIGRANVRLNDFVETLLPHANARMRSILREGDPASEILSQAARSGCDLLMMPTYSSNPGRLLLLGSVASRCLHAAPCPVWTGPHTVPERSLQSAALSQIVCPIPLGSDSSRVLEWSASLAAMFQCTLTVLHLAPRADLPTEDCNEHPWHCHALSDGYVTIPPVPQGRVVTRHVLLETGDVSKALPMVSERLNADLLVLDGMTSDESHLSIDAYAIIRASTCSILRL